MKLQFIVYANGQEFRSSISDYAEDKLKIITEWFYNWKDFSHFSVPAHDGSTLYFNTQQVACVKIVEIEE